MDTKESEHPGRCCTPCDCECRAPEMLSLLRELSERKWSDYCCGVHCDDGTEHDDECVYSRLSKLLESLK